MRSTFVVRWVRRKVPTPDLTPYRGKWVAIKRGRVVESSLTLNGIVAAVGVVKSFSCMITYCPTPQQQVDDDEQARLDVEWAKETGYRW